MPVKAPVHPVLTRPGWVALVVVAYVVLRAGARPPTCSLPAAHPLHLSDYFVTLVGKIMCYAIVALAMDLIWGYTGILSLGPRPLLRARRLRDGDVPDALDRPRRRLPERPARTSWCSSTGRRYPWYWSFTDHFWYAALLVVLVPGLLAFVFGFFAFRSRIKGVYFSIITQALTYAFMLLFFRNDTGFGGNNGFTDFKRILGFPIAAPETRAALFVATGVVPARVAPASAAVIVTSKLGRVLTAIRDAESRVMFSGYNPLYYKLFVWTLSAVLCGIAGALYVPQVGIINPGEMSPANSIEIAIWTAVGGRGTLIGPIVGAFVVNGAKSWFTQAFPEYLAVLPRPAVHPRHAVPAARRDRALRGGRGARRRHDGARTRSTAARRASSRPGCASPARASTRRTGHPLSRRRSP